MRTKTIWKNDLFENKTKIRVETDKHKLTLSLLQMSIFLLKLVSGVTVVIKCVICVLCMCVRVQCNVNIVDGRVLSAIICQ
jgi:hypothetical protein